MCSPPCGQAVPWLSLSPTHAWLAWQTPAQYSLMEKDALKVAQEMQAEYWAVSSLTGESQLGGEDADPSVSQVRGHSGRSLPMGQGRTCGISSSEWRP